MIILNTDNMNVIITVFADKGNCPLERLIKLLRIKEKMRGGISIQTEN